jgi:hypothetical protein
VNAHAVEHFWLCGRCAATYTLQYHNACGVTVKLQSVTQYGKDAVQ